MKNLLAALALSTMLFSGMSSIAFADEAVCKTPSQVIADNEAEGNKMDGVKLKSVTVSGAEAKAIHDYLAKKYEGTTVSDFDQVTFTADDNDKAGQEPVLMVLYKDGCAVTGGLIKPEEFVAMAVIAGGKAPASPEVIDPNNGL